MAPTASYYQSVVRVAQEYLGPAAERFIRRQVDFHLNKAPEDINSEDVKKLSTSISIALGLLIDDKSMAQDAERRFKELANQKGKEGK